MAAVGVGIPSVVDFETGTARASVNVPLADVSLRTVLGERLGLSVYIDNDATVAALAEQPMGRDGGPEPRHADPGDGNRRRNRRSMAASTAAARARPASSAIRSSLSTARRRRPRRPASPARLARGAGGGYGARSPRRGRGARGRSRLGARRRAAGVARSPAATPSRPRARAMRSRYGCSRFWERGSGSGSRT